MVVVVGRLGGEMHPSLGQLKHSTGLTKYSLHEETASVEKHDVFLKHIEQAKSATKKQWQKYKIWAGFEPGTPRRKANTITTELKRIHPNAVVRYCI